MALQEEQQELIELYQGMDGEARIMLMIMARGLWEKHPMQARAALRLIKSAPKAGGLAEAGRKVVNQPHPVHAQRIKKKQNQGKSSFLAPVGHIFSAVATNFDNLLVVPNNLHRRMGGPGS